MSIKNLYQSSSEQTSLKMTIGLQQQHRHIHRKVKVHVYAHNKLTLSFKKKKNSTNDQESDAFGRTAVHKLGLKQEQSSSAHR